MRRERRQRRSSTAVDGPRILPAQGSRNNPLFLAAQKSTSTSATVPESLTVQRTSQLDPSVNLANPSVPSYPAGIQNPQMTLASFIATKFIPEHVAFKTGAGQTHYKAILKHLLTPELVNCIFTPGQIAPGRLSAVPEWPYVDSVRLCEVTVDHVRRLVRAAEAAGYSSQTVKHIKNVFFAIISHAQREGCFHGPNPAGLVKLPKLERQNLHHLSFQQTRAILELMQHPAKAVAIFTITTGMTLKEIFDLQWNDVNLGNAECIVEGEPRPPMSLVVKAPWSKASIGTARSYSQNRHFEIREPLLSVLTDLRRLNPHSTRNDRVVSATEKDELTFFHVCTSHLKQVGKLLGIPWLTWQVLRRVRSSVAGEFLACLNGAYTLLDTDEASDSSGDAAISNGSPVIDTSPVVDVFRRRTFCFGERIRQKS